MNLMSLPIVFFLFLTIKLSHCSILVLTGLGTIEGKEHTSLEKEKVFYSFRGIPYAEPPIGKLRFADPVPVKAWDVVKNGTEEPQHCFQANLGSEDCLYLNLYTPQIPTSDEACTPLPTMVWIHGGGFFGGESQFETSRPDFFIEENIVIVTIHYRVGALGFLSTGDEIIPGNFGLKDQLTALQWVHNHVSSFCGNPNDVTLAGQSAGSASIAYHLQSPKADKLFHRVILQSGTSLNLWTYSRRAASVAIAIGAKLALDVSSSESLLAGLQAVGVEELQEAADSEGNAALLAGNPLRGFVFAPVAEADYPGALYSGRSHQMLLKGGFSKVPILLGYNSLEGKFEMNGVIRAALCNFDKDLKRLPPVDLNLEEDKMEEVALQIKDFYFRWLPLSLSKQRLLEYISDDQFVRGIIEFSNLVRNYTDVYLYKFSYEGELSGNYDRSIPGVAHSEELHFFWQPNNKGKTDLDLTIRRRLLKMWTNFIKTGNPTPNIDPELQNVIWSQVDDDLTYLEIGEDLKLLKHQDNQGFKFWENLYEKYGIPPYDTY